MSISPKDMKRIMNSPYRLLAPVERLLLENNDENTGSRDVLHLHPSEICKKDWCPRSSYYKIIGLPEKPRSFTLQTLNVFAEGHLIHEKWQKWLTEAGVLEQAEVPIYNEEHRIMGHADGIVSDSKGRAVLEIKSVGVGTVRFEDYGLFAPYSRKEITLDELWASIKFPFASHIRQAQLYMYCLGIEEGLILYEWKASQDVREFSIKYQPELVEPILASCLTVVRALQDDTVPVRPSWLDQEHKVCKSCAYKEYCYENSVQQGSDRPNAEVSVEVRPARQTTDGDSNNSREPRRVIRQQIDESL